MLVLDGVDANAIDHTTADFLRGSETLKACAMAAAPEINRRESKACGYLQSVGVD